MNKIHHPKTVYELKLLKQQLSSNVKHREDKLTLGMYKLRESFTGMIKASAMMYTQKLASNLMMRLFHSRR